MSTFQLNEHSSSNSDSSLNSWTVVNDESAEEVEDNCSTRSEDLIKINSKTENVLQPPVKVEQTKSNGFLTFDEFLQERLLDYDYDQEEKPIKLKRKINSRSYKELRKCKAPNLGISIFFAIMLALTGFATLCSTLSQPHSEQKPLANLDKDYNIFSLKKTYTTRNERDQFKKNFESAAEEFKTLGKVKFNNTLNRSEIYEKKNYASQVKPLILKHHNLDHLSQNFKLYEKNVKKNLPTIQNKTTNFSSKWQILQKILLDTNIHAIISLIVTNLYLFTILLDISKRDNKVKNANKNVLEEIIADLNNNKYKENRNLWKELPFWGYNIIDKKENILKLPNDQFGVTKSVLCKGQPIQDKFKPFVFKATPIFPDLLQKKVSSIINKFESGKSECERRFDELDLYQQNFDTLKQNQRNRIKLLKQKFQNEIAYIKNTESESKERAERIHQTSQKFINKLKGNREKYLWQVKKAKELKTKKDAKTGVYEVVLPNIYNYSTSLNRNID